MQIKVISVPALDGEIWNDDLNKFLRGHKVLKVEQQLLSISNGAYWTFCIHYIDGQNSNNERKERTDYKEILSAEAFGRFAKLRSIRKAIADEDQIPAFAVFTDAELADMAQLDEITENSMRQIKGIGDKKIEKYASRILKVLQDEKSQ